MRIACTIVALLLLVSAPAFAQDGIIRLSYDFAFGLGDTKEFVSSDPSWRGFTFEYRHFITPNISVGGTAGWQVFDHETTDLITIRDAEVDVVDGETITLNGDISGTQFRFLNSFPIMGTVHYHMGDEFGMQPFFGIGVGTQRVEERLEIGRFVTERANWKFAIAPEAGVLIPVSNNIKALVGVRYQLAVASGT